MDYDKIIIGIDPGTLVMGYGIIASYLGEKTPKLIQYGVLNLKSYDGMLQRLEKIWERLETIIEEYKPNIMAIESPFYGKNIQVMLKLGRVQGLIMASALKRNISIKEYYPREIKQALTGNGNASKQQVASMVSQVFSLKRTQETLFDSTDALATALCAFYNKSFEIPKKPSKKKASSWASFVQNNPSKIVENKK